MVISELRKHLATMPQDATVYFALNDDMIEIKGGIKITYGLIVPNSSRGDDVVTLTPITMKEVGGF